MIIPWEIGTFLFPGLSAASLMLWFISFVGSSTVIQLVLDDGF